MEATTINYQPYGDNIVIRKATVKEQTDSGIIKPDSVLQKEANEAGKQKFQEVVAIGEDCKHVAVGDKILFTGAAVHLTFEGEEYWQFREYQALGKEV